MRLRSLSWLLVASLAATIANAQQPLVCATSPAGRPCDVFHFHVQVWRPDAKQFVELTGLNRFATQASCDRARVLYASVNARAVEYLRGVKENVEADRVGPCHCDMTGEKSAPNFLTEAQRETQLRVLENTRLRLREKLLDNKLTSDAEIVRALWADPPSTPQLEMPKLAPLPQSAPAPLLTATEDLKATATIDTAKPAIAALDLPLVEIGVTPEPVAAAAAAPAPATDAAPAVATASAATPAAVPEPQQQVTEEIVVPAPVATETHAPDVAIESTQPEEDLVSAQETAEKFIRYEKERIQNVLRASSAIDDEKTKSKIFEACMQRIQLLSNLRALIEGSGMRSRLAAAARDATQERERLALIGRLFGEEVKPHWAPSDAAEVIFEVDPAIAAEPERALRDTTGRVSLEQKKRALYLVLAQSQPTEDQLLWLSGVVDGFLK
ncbi:MAG: hypothetical protein M3Q69_17855 [Acidobacteriota bacterium]|nr:hypothetical protein [Acidobacteriota bacterium]